jgi:hypothetical protein
MLCIPRSERTPSLCANIYDRRTSQSAPYRQSTAVLHRQQLQHKHRQNEVIYLIRGTPPETLLVSAVSGGN